MAKRYFNDSANDLRETYNLDLVEDILLGKKDRVLVYADVSDIANIKLRAIHNSFELIGLEQRPFYSLEEILDLVVYDNKYAEVSGKDAYQKYIKAHVYTFNQETDVSFPIMTKLGKRWVRYNGYPIEKNKNVVAIYLSDITTLLNSEEELYEKLHKDALTKLFNKYTFDYHYGIRYQLPNLHVLYMDLDDFKNINDHYGHDVGNQLLIAFSKILKFYETEFNKFYRIGGDEFIGLIFEEEAVIKTIAQQIIDKTQRLHINSTNDCVTLSIGIVKAMMRTDLVRKADDILYKVKNAGKNHFIYEIET